MLNRFRIIKKRWLLILVMSLLLSIFSGMIGYATNYESTTKVSRDVTKYIDKTAAYMQKNITNPIISSTGGEWTIIGLARSDIEIPQEYYKKYYFNVERILKQKSGKLHHVKYTEYSRLILALTSIGKDITNVAGYDLREPLADFDTLTKQGINGPIFALMALDCNTYEIPKVKGVKTQTTRDKLIDFILEKEIKGGGWALGQDPKEGDPDVTAMAIQALTPYYESHKLARQAIDRGIKWLSNAQQSDGGYSSWGSKNSESIAQVIVALTGLGIDPHKDVRFVKNGKSTIDALLSYAIPEGGFYHIKPGKVDLIATDQAMYALVAYNRFIKGQNRLYDMTDIKIGNNFMKAS